MGVFQAGCRFLLDGGISRMTLKIRKLKKFRKIFIGAALVIIGLPVALILIAVVSISVLDRTNGRIVSSGEEREYLLYVSPNYDSTKPTPLVISMHAGATWPAQQKNLSGWNRLADEHGFIVVYPSGTGEVGLIDMPRIWPVDRESDRTRDVRFISELIDTLEATYNIDPTRIYANGMSNGGAMAFVLSCTLSDRIAAVGMVAAAQSRPFDWCTDDRPVPMIAFHGTADPIVPYQGGPLGDPFNPVKPIYPPVRDWTAKWARRNRCGLDPVESVAVTHVTRLEYTDCAEDATVVLYTIQGGGHTWPGGKPLPEWRVGSNSNNIDATRQMWAFFRDHRLPRK
jgi:polyhydroxybutyrate depolymerase